MFTMENSKIMSRFHKYLTLLCTIWNFEVCKFINVYIVRLHIYINVLSEVYNNKFLL